MNKEIEFVTNIIRTKKKVHGLRILYKKYNVKKEDYPKWRELWNLVERDLCRKPLKIAEKKEEESEPKPSLKESM